MDPEGEASATGSSTSSGLPNPAARRGSPTPRRHLPVGGSMAPGGNRAEELRNPPQHKRQSLQDLRQAQKDITTQNKTNHPTTHDITSARQHTSRPAGEPGSLVETRPALGPPDEHNEGPQPRRKDLHKDNLTSYSRAKPRPRRPARDEHSGEDASPDTKTASSSHAEKKKTALPTRSRASRTTTRTSFTSSATTKKKTKTTSSTSLQVEPPWKAPKGSGEKPRDKVLAAHLPWTTASTSTPTKTQ